MHPVGFEPTVPASERPQTYALDRAVTGTDSRLFKTCNSLVLLHFVSLSRVTIAVIPTRTSNKWTYHLVTTPHPLSDSEIVDTSSSVITVCYMTICAGQCQSPRLTRCYIFTT